jgi:hypothetical protein
MAAHKRTEPNMHDIAHLNASTTVTTQLCSRCCFYPASPRIWGYCSWDCHDADADADDDEDDEQAA